MAFVLLGQGLSIRETTGKLARSFFCHSPGNRRRPSALSVCGLPIHSVGSGENRQPQELLRSKVCATKVNRQPKETSMETLKASMIQDLKLAGFSDSTRSISAGAM